MMKCVPIVRTLQRSCSTNYKKYVIWTQRPSEVRIFYLHNVWKEIDGNKVLETNNILSILFLFLHKLWPSCFNRWVSQCDLCRSWTGPARRCLIGWSGLTTDCMECQTGVSKLTRCYHEVKGHSCSSLQDVSRIFLYFRKLDKTFS